MRSPWQHSKSISPSRTHQFVRIWTHFGLSNGDHRPSNSLINCITAFFISQSTSVTSIRHSNRHFWVEIIHKPIVQVLVLFWLSYVSPSHPSCASAAATTAVASTSFYQLSIPPTHNHGIDSRSTNSPFP